MHILGFIELTILIWVSLKDLCGFLVKADDVRIEPMLIMARYGWYRRKWIFQIEHGNIVWI